MYETNTGRVIKELRKTANTERIASRILKKLNQTEFQEMALKLEISSSKKKN